MRIVFFGTPQFAADILQYLIEKGLVPVAVVTKQDKAVGRSVKPMPPAVKKICTEQIPEVPLFQPEKVSTPEMVEKLTALNPDLFVVVAYGEILRQEILDIPRKGAINVHASLLPLLRGAAPIQQAILEGHAKSGVTIMEMVLKMDAGDSLAMAEVVITDEMTAGELEQKLCESAKPLLLDVILNIDEKMAQKKPQAHEKATYVKKIVQEDCEIAWDKDALEIHNKVRAFQPRPGAWCEVTFGEGNKRLKIHRTRVVDRSGSPGQLLEFSQNGIIVAAGKKALQIESLQLEGKKSMTAKQFVSGFPPFTLK